MPEGKKNYSLIVKDESGVFYRIKIDGNYYNTLADIDDYCINAEFLWNINMNYKLNVKDAYIIYKTNGQIKAIEPLRGVSNNFSKAIKDFKGVSVIDFTDKEAHKNYPSAFLCIKKLVSGLLKSYQNNNFVRAVFDKQGSCKVREILHADKTGNNSVPLFLNLCKYREFRQAQTLYENALQGKEINTYPKTFDELLDADIKLIEERELELVNNQISEFHQKLDEYYKTEEPTENLFTLFYEEKLNELYEAKEGLEENISSAKSKGKKVKSQKNKGQSRIIFPNV